MKNHKSKPRKKIVSPLLFTFDSHDYMKNDTRKAFSAANGKFKLERFSNEEIHIALQDKVKDRKCYVLGSISPPDSNLFSFLALCHTLKKEKAASVTAVLPYFAYSRHDKNEPHKSHMIALIAQLLYDAGVNRIITVDVHSKEAERLFSGTLHSLSPAKLFAQEIQSHAMKDATVVAPDKGAIERCVRLSKELKNIDEIAYFIKQRTSKGISHSKLHGHVSECVIIVDDMLDTGGTLISCCKCLSRQGVKEIWIIVTHGLFTGNKWKQLWKLGVTRIYCTNTIPLAEYIRDKRIVVLPISPIFSFRI
jgi:ribose-phosphate pyrophosphokinase